MFSYHLAPLNGDYWVYSRDWRTADTLDMTRIARCLTQFVWSPCVWRGGIRGKANFLSATIIGLDFESPDFTLAEALKAFCDCRHVIGTTRSHGTDKGGKHGRPIDCFRVVLQWQRPITDQHTYRHCLRLLAKHYPHDLCAIDTGRLFYPCKEIVSVNNDADAYPWEVLTPPPPEPLPPVVPGYEGRWAREALSRPFPINHYTEMCWRIARDLAAARFSQTETEARLLHSPTYKNGIDTQSLKKLREAVKSAYKSIEEGRLDGR